MPDSPMHLPLPTMQDEYAACCIRMNEAPPLHAGPHRTPHRLPRLASCCSPLPMEVECAACLIRIRGLSCVQASPSHAGSHRLPRYPHLAPCPSGAAPQPRRGHFLHASTKVPIWPCTLGPSCGGVAWYLIENQTLPDIDTVLTKWQRMSWRFVDTLSSPHPPR